MLILSSNKFQLRLQSGNSRSVFTLYSLPLSKILVNWLLDVVALIDWFGVANALTKTWLHYSYVYIPLTLCINHIFNWNCYSLSLNEIHLSILAENWRRILSLMQGPQFFIACTTCPCVEYFMSSPLTYMSNSSICVLQEYVTRTEHSMKCKLLNWTKKQPDLFAS